MPMSTTLRSSVGAKPSCHATASNWPTISPRLRLRPKPSAPVAQKAQPAGQPTIDDTHTVFRSLYGM
jgi:hypothetical protein